MTGNEIKKQLNQLVDGYVETVAAQEGDAEPDTWDFIAAMWIIVNEQLRELGSDYNTAPKVPSSLRDFLKDWGEAGQTIIDQVIGGEQELW